MKTVETKKTFAELKEKAGKAFLDANSVKGGVLANCHQIQEPKPDWTIKTDNL